MKKKQHSNIS